MFPLEQGAAEMVVIGILALIVVGPKDLPVLMRRVGQAMAKMRGLAAEFRASFDEMARQSELDELRKEVENLRTTASAPLGAFKTDLQAEMDALNGAYRNPPYGEPSPATTTAPQPSVYEPTVYEEPPIYQEPRGFAFPPQPLAYEPPVFDTPAAEVAEADEPAAKPKAPRKPRAPKATTPVEVAAEPKAKALRKPRAAKAVPAAPSEPEA